jgi:hypothetical protein
MFKTDHARARKTAAASKKRAKNLQKKADRDEELQAAQGPQLPECADKHTRASLEKQFETAVARREGGEQTLHALLDEAPFVFHDWADLLQFFEDNGARISRNSLGRWSRGEGLGSPGGFKTGFGPGAEQMLVDAILASDSLGYPMGRREVCALAWEFADDPKIKARFSAEGPTRKWYTGFIERAKLADPGLLLALQRGTDCRTLKWFNTPNVEWWFGLFNKKIRQYGFARAPAEGEEGESV